MSKKALCQKRIVNENQCYKCKGCGYQWTRTTPRGHSSAQKRLSVLLYCHGISILFDVSVPAVLKWIHAFAKKHTLTPDTCVSLEFDEMWHYIRNKKNKLWIWKALDRNSGYLIDWECGGRDKQTLEKLMARLSPLNVKIYWTDKWQVYETVLPTSKHVQDKAETYCIDLYQSAHNQSVRGNRQFVRQKRCGHCLHGR